MAQDRTRLVYSTESGRVCAVCGWPMESQASPARGSASGARTGCRCSTAVDEKVPPRVTAKLRLETKGRSGKNVTVVDGLPRNAPFVAELSQVLKKSCGTGGTVREGAVELQGDCREKLRPLLLAKGFHVKG